MSGIYHLMYSVIPRPEGFDADDVDADHGACDAIVIHSLLYPPDGFSIGTVSHDGRTGERLDPTDEFKVWVTWAKRLSEDEDLSPAKREFAHTVFETYRQALLAARRQS